MSPGTHRSRSDVGQTRREAQAIQGVVFDLDGLMLRSEPMALEAWQRSLAPYGARMEDDEYRSLIGLNQKASIRQVIRSHRLRTSPGDLDRDFWSHMLALVEKAEVMPGLFGLLQEIQRRGLPLGVASNSLLEYVLKALLGHGLAEYFRCIAAVDQVARGKPAPDVYLAAARALGLPAEACLAVEDSPSGVRAAVAAGMLCVFIPNHDLPSSSPNGATAVYPSLRAWHDDLDRLIPWNTG
jgi:HAD superfamily hydrolase (TIGR01509 family)